MRIYVAHPTGIDYENEIYRPLRKDSFFLEHELILPHEDGADIGNLRDDYEKYDIAIAECSEPSIGVGIELGWFYDDRKPIYCFVKSGLRLSNAVTLIVKEVIEYDSEQDFVEKVKSIINRELSR